MDPQQAPLPQIKLLYGLCIKKIEVATAIGADPSLGFVCQGCSFQNTQGKFCCNCGHRLPLELQNLPLSNLIEIITNTMGVPKAPLCIMDVNNHIFIGVLLRKDTMPMINPQELRLDYYRKLIESYMTQFRMVDYRIGLIASC